MTRAAPGHPERYTTCAGSFGSFFRVLPPSKGGGFSSDGVISVVLVVVAAVVCALVFLPSAANARGAPDGNNVALRALPRRQENLQPDKAPPPSSSALRC